MQARFRKTIALAAICGATIVGTVAVSAASVDAKGTKKQFCNAAVKVGTTSIRRPIRVTTTKKAAAKLEKSFDEARGEGAEQRAEERSGRPLRLLRPIADGDAGDSRRDEAKAYGKAVTKFATYLATKCVSTQIPDITLPDITPPVTRTSS